MLDAPQRPVRLGRSWLVGLGLLLIVAGLLYGPALGFEFLQTDDPYYLTERPEIQALEKEEEGAWGALLSPARALAGDYWEYYPVRDLSYGAEVSIAGLDPAVFHGTQVALHLLFVLLVFLLGWQLGLHPGVALGGAAAVALHPLAVEPVCWVSSRKDVLMSVFVLGSILALLPALRSSGRARLGWGLLAGVLALLAFGSKGPGIIAVLMAMWLILYLRPAPPRRGLVIGLGVMALAAGAWFLMVRHVGVANEIFWPHPDGAGRWFRALGVPVRVAWWFLYPADLCPYYGPWMFSWFEDPWSWVAVLVVALAAMGARRRGWRISPGLFLLGAFGLAVLPASGVVAVAHLRADRFYYLSLAFAGLGAGALVHLALVRLETLPSLAQRTGLRVVAALVCLGFLGSWALTAHRGLAVWKDQDSMWSRVMEVLPEKHFVLAVRAEQRLAAGEIVEARDLLHRALEVADQSPQKKGRFYLTGGHRDVLWTAHIWLLLSESWTRTAQATAGPAQAEARRRAVLSLQQSIAKDPEYAPTWFFENVRRAAHGADADGAMVWSAKLLAIPGIALAEGERLAGALELDGHPELAAAVRAQWRALHPSSPKEPPR